MRLVTTCGFSTDARNNRFWIMQATDSESTEPGTIFMKQPLESITNTS